MDSTHYETLGVPEDATAEEITAAWRILMRKNHPDIAGAEGSEKSALVNASYTVLGDENSRILYNADLRRERERDNPRITYQPPFPETNDVPSEHFVPDEEYEGGAPEARVDDEPLRVSDFTDHPVTRKNLGLGAFGLVSIIAGVILMSLTLSDLVRISLLSAAVLAVVTFVIPFLRRVTIVPVAFGVVSAGVYIYLTLDLAPISTIGALLMLLSYYPLRRGVQSLLSIRSQIAESKREIAQRRHAEKVERKRQEQAQEAARRRAARDAKRSARRDSRRQ